MALWHGDATAQVWIESTNKAVVEEYFNLLESALKHYNLTDCPAQIYNMDETGMPLDHRSPNVIAKCCQLEEGLLTCGWQEGADYCYMLWECCWAVNTTYGCF